MTIRTRFAPSPTGYLHIGGVRTALFNWLLTRRLGGQFILRIDDTDAERNRPEALQPILDGFRWLGITWDEGPEVGGPYGPYFQSQRHDHYRAAAMKLLDGGHAYPCYMAKETLDAQRKEAEKAKKNYVHRGEHRATPAAENRRLYDANPTTLRLKVPQGQKIVIQDHIRGKVEWDTDLMGDPVILRVDGRALYNFATVVDDVDLKITHVVRAAEHLTNTAVQVVVYQALGVPLPEFAHIPVVNEPNSTKKLSKRDMKKFVTEDVRSKLKAVGWTGEEIDSRDDLNPATIAFYRELGYLPAALVNYLSRLGWSLDDKTEIMSLDTLIQNFGLDRVNTKPASFDPVKLKWVAGQYMKDLPLDAKVAGVMPFLRRAKFLSDSDNPESDERVRLVVRLLGERITVFSDILQYAPQFFGDPRYDGKAVKKHLATPQARALLNSLASWLPTISVTDPALLQAMARTWCEGQGTTFKAFHPILRVAVTGAAEGADMFETIALLGCAEVVRRVNLALIEASRDLDSAETT